MNKHRATETKVPACSVHALFPAYNPINKTQLFAISVGVDFATQNSSAAKQKISQIIPIINIKGNPLSAPLSSRKVSVFGVVKCKHKYFISRFALPLHYL